ncbi:MAG: hypothetical protein QM626_05760 [Microbacterium sp.]|uniref:hypothetical protein n=1 Tax=Microbacterium sp. TaxID=51671 RepID=UPI0039E500BE
MLHTRRRPQGRRISSAHERAPRLRLAALGTGLALAVGALIIVPTAAYADDSVPDAGDSEVAADATSTTEATSADASTSTDESATADDAVADDTASDDSATAASDDPVTEDAATEDAVTEDAATDETTTPVVETAAEDATVEDVLASDPEEPTITLFAEAAALPAEGDACYPAVCITNGTILLAVNPTAELNATDGTGSLAGPGDVGLDYLPTNNDSTSPGCLCEGWGVADPDAGIWGGANLAELGVGGRNLTVESFTYTDSTATSVVIVSDDDGDPYLRVTHEYIPSPATPNLYQVNVTIQNVSGAAIATIQYRRVMDWDIEPTAFNEYTTIDSGTASAITFTSDNGFASSNPLSGPSSILFTGDAVDSGPADHGALFDFTFPGLADGASFTFVIYYGAAGNETDAIAALAAVGAEAYSFGQTSTDPTGGTPNTFIFAFGNVGGTAIFSEPDTTVDTTTAVATTEESTAVTAVALAVTGGTEPTFAGLAGALLVIAGLVLVGAAALRPRRA